MASNDLLSGLGLGGLVKGLSSLMPQDNLDVKIFNAQTEVDELKKQQNEIFAEIGKAAYAAEPTRWPQADKLALLQTNLDAAVANRDALGAQKKQEEEANAAQSAAREAADAPWRCPSCGHQNPEGTKFCQECGTKLGKTLCVKCGAELAPGTRFCGACGAKQDAAEA
ncbi:MAG: zinc ribbon domain-containing protein [Lachnospiraceae bacterium]|jgi:ribosomal protein L40E|nr:zinc ribbon domain-containing protein [Lachnospiraceae bacterium]